MSPAMIVLHPYSNLELFEETTTPPTEAIWSTCDPKHVPGAAHLCWCQPG
jgi:hypothetical protein